MRIFRLRPRKRIIDDVLAEGIVQVVIAADYVGYAHIVIVNNDGEHIGRRAVGAQKHEIIQLGILHAYVALNMVFDYRFAVYGGFDADGELLGLAGREVCFQFFLAGQFKTAIVFFDFIQLFGRKIAFPRFARIQQFIGHFGVTSALLVLRDDFTVPIQFQPFHGFNQRGHRVFGVALAVCILNPKQHLAVVALGVQPVKEGGARCADMHEAGGGWREAGDDGHVFQYLFDFKAFNAFRNSIDLIGMQELIKSHIFNMIAEQRPQIVLWCPVLFGLGVLLYFGLRFEPPLYVGGVMTLPVFAGLWAFRENGLLRISLLYLLCGVLGFTAAQLRTNMVQTPILMKEMSPVEATGRIVVLEDLGLDQGQRIVLDDVTLERVEPEDTPQRIRLKLRKDQDLEVGQRVRVLAGLNPPAAPALPGGFDFQRYMFFQGIGAIGFSYGAVEVITPAQRSGFQMGIEDLRNRISGRIMAAMQGPRGGISAALMVGKRGAISEGDNEAMRASGLAHMLAISGLHIGLFSGVVFFFIRLCLVLIPGFALQYPVKKIAAVAAIAAAVFYMLIAGATIPTQRAVFMTGVAFVAILFDRSPLSMRLVAFAALCVLVVAPESLMSVSFQMSFSAVAGLVAFYDATRGWWKKVHAQAGWLRRLGLYVLSICMTTVIATFATAPFALYHFQTLAVYGVLGNVLAMPVLTFWVMPLSVLAYALMPFGLEGAVFPIMGQGVQAILSVAHWVAGMENAVLRVAAFPLPAFLFFASALLVLVLVKGRLRVIALPLCLISVMAIYQHKQPFILLYSDLNLIGYRSEAGSFYASNLRKDKFTRGIWERSYGLEDGAALGFPKEGREGDIACGEAGCRVERGGHKVSWLKYASDASEECGWANIVVVQEPVKRRVREECGEDVRVIDMFDARNAGVHAFYEAKPLKIVTSNELRGKRPWVADR